MFLIKYGLMGNKSEGKGSRRDPIVASRIGQLGGFRVLELYGTEHYVRLGRMVGGMLSRERGHQYFQEIAQAGGQATLARHGTEHFSHIGTVGGEALKAQKDPDYYKRIGQKGGRAKAEKRKKEQEERA